MGLFKYLKEKLFSKRKSGTNKKTATADGHDTDPKSQGPSSLQVSGKEILYKNFKNTVRAKEDTAVPKTQASSKARAPAKAAQPTRHYSWQQYKGKTNKESDIVIGFDLGTSCSKVVIQDRVLKKAYAVPFDHLGCKGNRYLLPTIIGVEFNKRLTLDKQKSQIDALKTRFLKDTDLRCRINDFCITSTECICAYIGLALMEIRDWFWREKGKDYQGRLINWELNIGMPSRSYDDDGLCRKMKELALGGWQLSLNDSPRPLIADVKMAMQLAIAQCRDNNCDSDKGELHPDNVVPIPEIIAQVIGYARSPLRRNGMYLMVDVGASTLDVSTFILHENEGEDVYSILVAEVEKMGAAILHSYRIQNAQKAIESMLDPEGLAQFKNSVRSISKTAYDGISPLPELEPLFPSGFEKAVRKYRRLNEEFLVECSRVVRCVIRETMERKNPLSDAWNKGLPVFLCGGGSKIESYQRVIPDAQERLRNTAFSGFIQRQIPKPTNLETDDIPPRDYHRMSVAYGLSFSSIDIGDIMAPAAIKDRPCNPIIRDVADLFIDKDMV